MASLVLSGRYIGAHGIAALRELCGRHIGAEEWRLDHVVMDLDNLNGFRMLLDECAALRELTIDDLEVRLQGGETVLYRTATPKPVVHNPPTECATDDDALSRYKKDLWPRYRPVRVLGSGSYGTVLEAFDAVKRDTVAIKCMPDPLSCKVDTVRTYRELRVLSLLRGSVRHCITVRDVVPPSTLKGSPAYLVLDYMPTDLCRVINSTQDLSRAHVKHIVYQILKGVKELHDHGLVHRDIKPANVLIDEDCEVRLCDFGMAREMSSSGGCRVLLPQLTRQRSFDGDKTQHVATRWYRAPELILLQDYDDKVDVWGVGCILAELLGRRPLFQGDCCFPLTPPRKRARGSAPNAALDQLEAIFRVLGTPADLDWMLPNQRKYVQNLTARMGERPSRLHECVRLERDDDPVLDLLRGMLEINPTKRFDVDRALRYPFFTAEPEGYDPEPEPEPGASPPPSAGRGQSRISLPPNANARVQLYLDMYLLQAQFRRLDDMCQMEEQE